MNRDGMGAKSRRRKEDENGRKKGSVRRGTKQG